MATTLQADSFAAINIRERTLLAADVPAGSTVLAVDSTAGYVSGDFLYVGNLSREGCEGAVVADATNATTLTLVAGLKNPHRSSEPVTSVIGNLVHIYRAANVDGSVPDAAAFTVLATREIDADQTSTFFTDSAGSSAYWYLMTYYNAVGQVETALQPNEAVRGSDFGHYASISEIRNEAGFDNAYNLKDSTIDQQRRAAEAEINGALRGHYTTPFVKPLPQKIKFLTIRLAAGFLLQQQLHGQSKQGDDMVKDVRAQLKGLQDGTDVLDDDTQTPYDGQGVSSWPNDSSDQYRSDEEGGNRSFQISDTY